jgi:hypothetical protein
MAHKEVIGFITKHIIHRFGIPQTLTTDQGTSFVAKEVRDFVNSYGIKLLNSSPYYSLYPSIQGPFALDSKTKEKK